MSGPGGEEPFVREVRRQAERVQAARRLGFWQGLGLAGMVGWMVSLPAVAGALVGRWLDRLSSAGMVWTVALLALGLLAGCAAAWRHVRRELHE
jgi:ATP synthase protein I